jgi:hypothetical protein
MSTSVGDRSRTSAGDGNFDELHGPWKGRLHNFLGPLSLMAEKRYHTLTPLFFFLSFFLTF